MNRAEFANGCRLGAVLVAGTLLAASASSSSQSPQPAAGAQPVGPAGIGEPGLEAPQPQPMDQPRAMGLWKSSFGAVKLEADEKHGGLRAGMVQGVWMYQRDKQDVVGYFAGNMRGNVLTFSWQEPAQPAPLQGQGYIVFDGTGTNFGGRWWTSNHDRAGEWTGWRPTDAKPAPQGPAQQAQPYPAQPSPQSYSTPAPAPGPYPTQPQPR